MKNSNLKRSNSSGSLLTLVRSLFVILLCFGFSFSTVGCSEDDGGTIETLGITGVSIPNPLAVEDGSPVTLSGKGLIAGDALTFSSTDGTEYQTTVSSVTSDTWTFSFPDNFVSGVYNVYLTRGTTKINLSKVSVSITVNFSIPDKAGMTLKGVVHCSGIGVAGVEVSDGIEVTTTDNHGVYYLPSKKKYGYVFISLPGGYEVANDGNAPQFYARVNSDSPSTVEQSDFALTKVDNDKHVVLALTDFHLANRNNDIAQFENFAKDVNQTISTLSNDGNRVYVMSMGDESWDGYWYANSYALPQSYAEMQLLNAPTFHCMGNHDNDP